MADVPPPLTEEQRDRLKYGTGQLPTKTQLTIDAALARLSHLEAEVERLRADKRVAAAQWEIAMEALDRWAKAPGPWVATTPRQYVEYTMGTTATFYALEAAALTEQEKADE